MAVHPGSAVRRARIAIGDLVFGVRAVGPEASRAVRAPEPCFRPATAAAALEGTSSAAAEAAAAAVAAARTLPPSGVEVGAAVALRGAVAPRLVRPCACG